ncbi:hypothetical protein B5S33_g2543 [[Candida] boidinii]|nr:hypothetical protein B5S33_g2543 [[Candida] boidinii]
MADKEITLFLVDLAPSMQKYRDQCLEYIYNIATSKILRGKKQDKISIITYHNKETDNPMDDMEPGQWNNCKIHHEPILYSWENMLYLNKSIEINKDPVTEEEVDAPRALAVSLQYLDNLTTPKTKSAASSKFTNTIPTTKCSIILLTDGLSKCSFDGLIDPIVQLSRKLNTLISVVNFGLDLKEQDYTTELSANIDKYAELIEILQESDTNFTSSTRTLGSAVMSYSEALLFANDWRYEPMKLVKPTKIFDGEIRIGADIFNIDLQEAGFYKETKDYDKYNDFQSLIIKTHGFPCTKLETPIGSKMLAMHVNDETGEVDLIPLKHEREHVARIPKYKHKSEPASKSDENGGSDGVKETGENPEPQFDFKPIDDDEIMKAFNYGSSVIPVTDLLNESLKFPSFTGIDIISLEDKSSIPPWYYQGESVLLVTPENASDRDKRAFNLLTQAMLKLDYVAITRYVQKRNATIKIATLTPVKILTEDSKHYEPQLEQEEDVKRKFDDIENDDNESAVTSTGPKDYYGFVLVKLPFKEDEKIADFMKISGVFGVDKFAKKETHPDEEMMAYMDEFVNSMDLDNLMNLELQHAKDAEEQEEEPEEQIKNPYGREDVFVELNEFDSALPIARRKGLEFQSYGRETFNDITRKILALNSPRIHIVTRLLKDIVIRFIKIAVSEAESTGESEDHESATTPLLHRLISDDVKKANAENRLSVVDEIIESIKAENMDSSSGNLFIPDLVQKLDSASFSALVSNMARLFDVQYNPESEKKDAGKRRGRNSDGQDDEDAGEEEALPSIDDIFNMF